MKDNLRISSLRVSTHIGVHNWEQKILQPLLLDIVIPMDASLCQDQLSQTIDYDSLCQKIIHFIESNRFLLIETVATQVAQLIQKEFNIQHLSLSVSKPNAVKNAGNICININR